MAKTKSTPPPSSGAYTIIRLRGTQNLNPKTKDTLKYMRLNRVNHAVVLPTNETTLGMLQVAKDYVTWGEVDAPTLAEVIRTRGRLEGDRALTDAYLASNGPHKSIDALAAAIVAGKAQYRDVPGVKPIFRLHPARNGLEGIKRSVKNGGALGYRGQAINKLLGRMLGTGFTNEGDALAQKRAVTGDAADKAAGAARAAAPKAKPAKEVAA